MLILFYIIASSFVILFANITIKDSGVATVTRGDVGMIFYVTLRNIGSTRYHVNVKMSKCCEQLSKSDLDCGMMKLLGGDMGYLHPNITKNISLIYPNMYLHNRKGQCLISVKYEDDAHSKGLLKKSIVFDTIICEQYVSRTLIGFYDKTELSKCKTIDEDPLEKCDPVNCHMKYVGCRNYFNPKWKRCQKVPICISDPDKDLPDVSYYPVSNRCRDLEDIISVNDLKYLEKGIVEGTWDSQTTPTLSANLRCHHGALDNETGFCVCDSGWMSAPIDKDQYEPSLSIYHMCNIEINTWKSINGTRIKLTALIIAILGAGFAVLIIMIAFICHLCNMCLQQPTTTKTQSSVTSISSHTSTSICQVERNVERRGSLLTASKRDSLEITKKSFSKEHPVKTSTHSFNIDNSNNNTTTQPVNQTTSVISTSPPTLPSKTFSVDEINDSSDETEYVMIAD